MEVKVYGRSILGDGMQNEFFGNLFGSTSDVRHYCPAVDINESKDSFEVVVEVPGVAKDDLKVSINQNILSVSGKRPVVPNEGRRRIISEIARGEFSRKFKLPSIVNNDAVTTEYTKGVLRITLPKKEQPATKDIPIL